MVLSTASRWLGSANSNSKRIFATRSRPVWVEQATIFTWWSDNAFATSRKRRDLSSATTSTLALKVEPRCWSDHSTSTTRLACSCTSDPAFAQSMRWTLTPRPFVMNPMISSPGTGVQQVDSRTSTSSRPSTWIAGPSRVGRRGRSTRRSDANSSPSVPSCITRAIRCATPLALTWCSPIAAKSESRSTWPPSFTSPIKASELKMLCTGSPSRRNSATRSSLPVSIISSRRSRENHCRILFLARGLETKFIQSREGPASSDFAVKISHVSPECNS